jgi:signal transduction histidine kinase
VGGDAVPTALGRPARRDVDRAADETLRDLQRLLAESVQRLRRDSGCSSAVAWALRRDGTPYLAAADFVGDAPVEPDAASFAEIVALPGATDLEGPHATEDLLDLARRLRVRAVAPVTAPEAAPMAALLVSGEVRPRTLALLDSASRRLAWPLATALALGRLLQIDDEVRQLDRLAALGTLAAEIAHEVRNPLVTLQTFVELLPARREDPEFLTRYLDVVSGELRRMNRLLDLVLEHAQAGPPNAAGGSTAGPVLEALEELLRQRASQRGVVLEVRGKDAGDRVALAEDALRQVVDRVALAEDALRQVVLNLALNAIDATPGGGRVWIEARGGKRETLLVVRDEGPGIPAARRARVFEPFFSTRTDCPGGLGLAITRRRRGAGGRCRVPRPPPERLAGRRAEPVVRGGPPWYP